MTTYTSPPALAAEQNHLAPRELAVVFETAFSLARGPFDDRATRSRSEGV